MYMFVATYMFVNCIIITCTCMGTNVVTYMVVYNNHIHMVVVNNITYVRSYHTMCTCVYHIKVFHVASQVLHLDAPHG